MPDWNLMPRPAFDFALLPEDAEAGVTVQSMDGQGIVMLHCRKEAESALAAAVSAHFGLALANAPRRQMAGTTAFSGIGPGAWLVTSPGKSNHLAADLQEKLGAFAALTDQSDGYAMVRLGGPRLRDCLAKFIAVDLHHRSFGPSHVAVTLAAHMSMILSRLPDGADGNAVFELALFRSYAASFWDLLAESAAAFGLGRKTQGRG